MSNPLVDRILNNPLTFVAAKNPDKEVQTIKSAGYIVLNSSASSAQTGLSMAPKKTQKREEKRVKSMAEAIAAYTGRKYLTKAEKKQKLRGVAKPQPDIESSEDTQYESASEFPLDASFQSGGESMADAGGKGAENGEDLGETLGEGASMSLDEVTDKNGSDIGAESDSESTEDSLEHSKADQASLEPSKSKSPEGNLESAEVEMESEDGDFTGKESESESSSEEDSSIEEGEDGVEEDEEEEGRKDESGEENQNERNDGDVSEEKSEKQNEENINEAQEEETTGKNGDKSHSENGHLDPADLTNHDEDDEQIGQQNQDRLQLKKDLLQDMEKPLSDENGTGAENGNSTQNGSKRKSESPATHYTLDEPEESNVSGRITRKWPGPFKTTKPVGLLNFGVTCYMNLAIQIMVHIPAMQHYLIEVIQGKHDLKPKSVTHTFAELALRMWGVGLKKNSPRKYINPKKMVQRLEDINCMMSEWQQEDLHEYFMSLMSRLQEDSTPKGKKLNQLIIYDIFGGLLDQEVICQECKTSSVTKQEFYDLSLGLNKKRTRSNEGTETLEDEKLTSNKYTIEKSLRDFFSTEIIRLDKGDASSGYHCEKCKKRTVATKRSVIEKSPHTLMIHLKRFKFNGNSSLKVKQPIHYLKFLDLGLYSITKGAIKYQLMGVIVHEGRSILSGHYVAHCYQPDGTWSTYDDEYINKIDEATALSDPSAYCLVYTKLEEKTKKRAKMGNGASKRAKRA